jgi:glyoxylase-like metal-dependent hydrolase (beta-lactamase superfamily II)
MEHFRVGDFECWLLSDGGFWLDGGAMFGVVPKNLWSKLTAPDEHNRIPLALNVLLVKAHGKYLLIETGIDRKPGEKFRQMYGLSEDNPVLAQLKSLGVAPEAVDIVVNTHLHFDHAGLNTSYQQGNLVSTFPNARYIVQSQELQDALHPHERNKASYLSQNIEPILPQIQTVAGEAEILPGIRVLSAPGHTLGMQVVELESHGERLAYTADLVPTKAHVPLPYILAYDLYPMTTLETRKKLYQRWLEGDYQLVFTHQPTNPLGRLIRDEKGYRGV